MPELRWPNGRGRFVDRDSDRVDDPPRVVQPSGTVEVDGDTAAHYKDRGFVAVDDGPQDPSADDEADSESRDSGDEAAAPDGDNSDDEAGGDSDDDDDDTFNVESFLDRTPVDVVVEDIEQGQVDDHLDTVEAAADRVTVERAVDDRQNTVESE